MEEAALGIVVPWVAGKLVIAKNFVFTTVRVAKRAQQYRQMLGWTKSSLRISTVFDWGHTCDITEAIQNAANAVLTKSREPVFWGFTSLNFVCKAIGMHTANNENDDTIVRYVKSLWLNAMEWFLEEKSQVMVPSLSPFAQFLAELNKKQKDPVIIRLMELWFLDKIPEEVQLWEKVFKKHLEDIDDIRRRREYGWDLDPASAVILDEEERSTEERYSAEVTSISRKIVEGYEEALSIGKLCHAAYELYHGSYGFERCCKRDRCTLRNRAIRVRGCNGVKVVPLKGRSNSTHSRKRIAFTEAGWRELQSQWVRFIENWNAIVAKASEEFLFPWSPHVDDLVFHDMATGFVGDSRMLRRGAKYTSKAGTTIVHPGERAAVVSSQCRIIFIEDSAVERNGIRRKWKDAADEFATYALLRCDLVKRSRMTLSDAVDDWMSQYTKWDCAPTSLSDWKRSKLLEDAPKDHPVLQRDDATDDMRLVLLRQALGQHRSIRILLDLETEGSVFGGFVARETKNGVPEPNDRALLVDEPLKLSVSVYQASESEQKTDTKGVVLDTWGTTDNRHATAPGRFVKAIKESGRPTIFRLQADSRRIFLQGDAVEDKYLFA